MSTKWNVARYAKFCKDANEGLIDEANDNGCDIDAICREVADSCYYNELGLKEFIKSHFPKVTDPVGMLADDICYPGNCKAY